METPRWEWDTFNGHTYIWPFSGMNWEQAEEFAADLGGHLVTINDQAENEWLRRRFSDWNGNSSIRFWTGLNDIEAEGEFVWSSGEPVEFTNWGFNHPTNDTNSNAAYLWPDDGLWYQGGHAGSHRVVVEVSSVADADGDNIPDVVDAYPGDGLNNWDLRDAGADGIFGNEDDTVYQLSASYSGEHHDRQLRSAGRSSRRRQLPVYCQHDCYRCGGERHGR